MSEYKCISVYKDKKGNLYLISNGINQRHGIIECGPVNLLKTPFTDEQIVNIIKKSFEECPKDEVKYSANDLGALAIFLNKKTWSSAVSEKTLTNISFSPEEGYIISPYRKIPRRGYTTLNKDIRIDYKLNIEDFISEIKKGIELARL